MSKLLFASTAAVLATVVVSQAAAQCTKDTDCKGNRVCHNGQCIAPTAGPAPAPAPTSGYAAPAAGSTAPAPAPAPPPVPRGPLSFFQSGYATAGMMLSFHGWGGYTETWEDIDEDFEGDLDSEFMPGFRLAGYGVVSEGFHIGGYWTFFKADMEVDPDDGEKYDINAFQNMFGLTMKFGARLHERVWFGGATDIGLLITKAEVDVFFEDDLEMKPMLGLVLYPRVDLDVLIVDTGAFRLAFTAALGVFVSPISGGHPYDADDFEDYVPDGDEVKFRFWWVSPTLMLGLSLGA